MGVIRSVFKRIVYGYRANSETCLKHLRSEGVSIGEGTIIYDTINTIIDTQNPKLLKIGRNVRITGGVTILTHDYSWSVVSGVYGECIGGVAPVTIGDNVFIGVKSTILRGSQIGSNVIIGANSVVSGLVEDNSVYAGNPARKIMSLEEFYQKRKNRERDEIQAIVDRIDFDYSPEIWKYLREYSCQFEDAPESMKQKLMQDTGYYDKCTEYYKKTKQRYTLEDFRRR